MLKTFKRSLRMQTRMVILSAETNGTDLLGIASLDNLTGEQFYMLTHAADAPPPTSDDPRLTADALTEPLLLSAFAYWLNAHSPALIAGWNIERDIALLSAAYQRCGIPSPLDHAKCFDLQTLAFAAYELRQINLESHDGIPALDLESVSEAAGLRHPKTVSGALAAVYQTHQTLEVLLDRLAY